MPTSQNGFRANDHSLIETITIPGTDRKVALRRGAPGQLLAHWAGWFDKHIESIDGGQLDDWGYAVRPIRGSTTTLSNHAFGLAFDVNVPENQRGTVGQINRDVVSIFQRWGFTWGGTWHYTDPMHFEMNRLVRPE